MNSRESLRSRESRVESRERIFPAVAIVVTVGSGLATRALLSGWIAKYLGVALWATLVYFLILFIAPRLAVLRAFAICVGISFLVEFAQLTPGPMALYEIHPFFALAFGTTFNAPDLPAYTVGAALGAAGHALRSSRLSTLDSRLRSGS